METPQNTGMENKQNTSTILGFLIVVVIVFFAGTQFGAKTEIANFPISNYDAINSIFEIRSTDIVKGNNQNLFLIEYSDFGCPFCQRFHKTVEPFYQSGDLTWVYRHFPFKQGSDYGAVLANCVLVNKGSRKAFDFVDAVFSYDTGLSEAAYLSLARDQGLTDAEIDSCEEKESEAYKLLLRDVEDSRLLGVNGTPTSFLVNKKTKQVQRVGGAIDIDTLRDLINNIE